MKGIHLLLFLALARQPALRLLRLGFPWLLLPLLPCPLPLLGPVLEDAAEHIPIPPLLLLPFLIFGRIKFIFIL